MKKILFSLLLAFTFCHGEFKSMNETQLQAAIKQGTPIIDIRRAQEWKQFGVIKGSHKITFFDAQGKYDVQKWMTQFTKIVTSIEQPFVLVCAHANRTKAVGKMLSEQAGFKNVYELEGGIMYGWIDKGLKTSPVK